MIESAQPSRERLTELFLQYTRILSPFKHERAMADAVIGHLKALGVAVNEDRTGERVGGDTGNLWCVVQSEGEPHIVLGHCRAE